MLAEEEVLKNFEEKKNMEWQIKQKKNQTVVE